MFFLRTDADALLDRPADDGGGLMSRVFTFHTQHYYNVFRPMPVTFARCAAAHSLGTGCTQTSPATATEAGEGAVVAGFGRSRASRPITLTAHDVLIDAAPRFLRRHRGRTLGAGGVRERRTGGAVTAEFRRFRNIRKQPV